MRINIIFKINIVFKIIVVFLISASASVFAETEMTSQNTYPKTFINADGSQTVLPSKPTRILSTSVTISGTLLAIDAPLAATALTYEGKFFSQWADIAEQRSVEKAWPAGSVDLESAYIYEPDLIVVAWRGGDSARDQIAEFKQIAPTIILDYTAQSWQDLALRLGQATGLEEQAQQKISQFELFVNQSKNKLQIPEGETNIVAYFGPGATNAIALEDGVHADLLTDLGFKMEVQNRQWHDNTVPLSDFMRVHFELLTQLKADTTFLLEASDDSANRFMHDPILINLPSVQNKQVFGLGENSFRIDMYSATEIVNDIVQLFERDTNAG
ncbi:Fe2+-enterobactin ABC transporter substrate-binding protein [Vibrio atlanticus]|uniref:Fe2+-enterobactin ABC transporter substrate-binding protein n=1 Tax=Vibrio atlanticus TaxID=693153 RepID=UPI0022AEC7F6|nr:Fe2+-enterobactin ABC transporter substrate-binding protein [Vibrio atlanticus]MCZ4307767.1 Fe2+-enterobactin ABC transporter substrate-binding protein [Vibrio atlanticus]